MADESGLGELKAWYEPPSELSVQLKCGLLLVSSSCRSLFDKCLKTQETLVFIIVDRTERDGGNRIVRKLLGAEIREIANVTVADHGQQTVA